MQWHFSESQLWWQFLNVSVLIPRSSHELEHLVEYGNMDVFYCQFALDSLEKAKALLALI